MLDHDHGAAGAVPHLEQEARQGLGLALVKAFSALHGGEMTLESVLGEGTTVRVRLPFAAVGENGQALKPREAKIIPFKGAA